MSFLLNLNTEIVSEYTSKPVENAVAILKRDMAKVLTEASVKNTISLKKTDAMSTEGWTIEVDDTLTITAGDDLGFVYALLHISEKYLKVKPFWFWMDQQLETLPSAEIADGVYTSKKAAVRFRGWFFNDEVLMMKWSINGDEKEPWRMAFEALLRCGGNMTIPGTDKNSRLNRKMAADMGLWITHHHAEPLGAEIFVRAYPDVAPNFMEHPELFYKLWEDAVIEQKDCNVVWNLCFRGQGDSPFWSSDTTGQFDTSEKRGALISELIAKQCDIVKKYIKNPVFCTNLYGEIMELYKEGYVKIADDVIKVRADNGYGKMVTRRRDNHTARVPSMPEKDGGNQGIYYHVSFYDLQAANHITMLPNSVDFVDRELSEVLENGGDDFWVINCSNVRPHTYFLDAVRKKWFGQNITNESHSKEFAADYYGANHGAAQCLENYAKAMISYGKNDDEHAGEQFYTETARIIANRFITNRAASMPQLNWLVGEGTFSGQIKRVKEITKSGMDGLERYMQECTQVSNSLNGAQKELFDATILLQSKIHFLCAKGLITLAEAVEDFENGDYRNAFIKAGDSAALFGEGEKTMRSSEYGVWDGFYFNDCFADMKHSAYMARKVMGYIREFGDNSRHDKWYREVVYAPEDRNVFLLLVTDNHMTDEQIYEAMKKEL